MVAPLGRHDESARSRSGDFLDGLGDGVVLIAEEVGSSALVDLIGTGPFSPRIRRISRPASWRIWLRAHRGKLVAHRLNGALSGIEHPNLTELSRRQTAVRVNEGRLRIEIELSPVLIYGVIAEQQTMP